MSLKSLKSVQPKGIDSETALEFFRAAPIPYLVLDPDFTMVDANDARLKVTSQTRENTIGRNLFEVFPDNPDDLHATGVSNLRFSLEIVLKTKAPHRMAIQRYDIPINTPQGVIFEERYWSPLNFPILDSQGSVKYIIHQVEDITGQVKSQHQVADMKVIAKAIDDDKDLRERFVATLSHDLLTPLTAAKISAQLLGRRPEDTDSVRKFGQKIISNLERCNHMIVNLLDANRLKAGENIPLELTVCSLKNIVREVAEELSTVHGDRFTLKLPAGDVEGVWSSNGLKRILENLCNNAIKYGSKEENITISVNEDQKEVTVSVQNWGEIISPDDQQHLFDLYSRAGSGEEGKVKGWGLGLTLVKGLTEAHKGKITVNSSVKNGTVFSVTLPRDSSSA